MLTFLGRLFGYGLALIVISFVVPTPDATLAEFLQTTTFVDVAEMIFDVGVFLVGLFLLVAFALAIFEAAFGGG